MAVIIEHVFDRELLGVTTKVWRVRTRARRRPPYLIPTGIELVFAGSPETAGHRPSLDKPSTLALPSRIMDDYQDSPEDLARLVYGADPKHPEGISVLEVVREQVLQQFYGAANAAAKTICDIAAGRIALHRPTTEDQDGTSVIVPGARLQFEAAKRVLEFVVEPIKTDLKANADDAMIRMITTLQGKED